MTSRLKIGKPLTKTNPKNSYKFVFDFMHGDADGDSTTEFVVDKDNEYIDRFLEFMDAMDTIDPDDVKKKNRPKDWDFFMEQFSGTSWIGDEEKEVKHGIDFEWDRDQTCDGCRYASLSGPTVTYFDENGLEYAVKVQ